MDTQDILRSLANLEDNLKGIDSARQQVEQTVSAYNSTRAQLTKVAQDISTVSSSLNDIFDAIKSNETAISTELSTRVKTLLADIEAKIQSLGTISGQLIIEFKTACQSAATDFTNETTTAVGNLKRKTNSVVDAIAKGANDKLAEVSSALGEFSTLINSLQEELKASLRTIEQEHKATNEAAATDIKTSLTSVFDEFNRIKKDMDEVLIKYESVSSTLLIKIQDELQKILPAVQGISNAITSNQAAIMQRFDSVEHQQTELSTSINNTRNDINGAVSSVVSEVHETADSAKRDIVSNVLHIGKAVVESKDEVINDLTEQIETLQKDQAVNRIILILTMCAVGGAMLLGLL